MIRKFFNIVSILLALIIIVLLLDGWAARLKQAEAKLEQHSQDIKLLYGWAQEGEERKL